MATVTTYQQWLADGSPWKPSNPSAALALACKAHGTVYGIIGDVTTHLKAKPPEDHCPYSATPWPVAQPYPYVLAIDIMTTSPVVAQRIIAAKRAGRLPCLKYINWTDADGRCWHTSWQASEATKTSTDTGHIHCSWRSDHVTCAHATGFDPFVNQTLEVDMDPQGQDIVKGVSNAQALADIWYATVGQTVEGGGSSTDGGRFKAPLRFKEIRTAIANLASNPPTLTQAQINALAKATADQLIASQTNSLTAADHAGIVADVQAALRAGTGAGK
ncbi:hypothetical protein GCM10023322_69460 [Rugosimonospora acidiphila]|uniref:Uncharacterized protein n=1 Tax=Rugosimonospora acidiphila TaxID=556531 RepID=A0ABP9SJW3_9ACTN